MHYDIRPLKGVGSLEFGMLASEVRAILGTDFKPFKRAIASDSPCDYFPAIGLFAYYKVSGELEAVEFAQPAQPQYKGVDLLNLSFEDAKLFFKSKDTSLEIEVDSLIAPNLGISLYVPLAKNDPRSSSESVLVFELGYYD